MADAQFQWLDFSELFVPHDAEGLKRHTRELIQGLLVRMFPNADSEVNSFGSVRGSGPEKDPVGHYRFTAACQLNTTENGDGVACPAGTASRNRSPSLVTAHAVSTPGTWHRALGAPITTPRSAAKATDVMVPFGAR